MFNDQYGLNTVTTDKSALLFGVVAMGKTEDSPIGVVIEELSTVDAEQFPEDLNKILTAMAEKLKKPVKKIAATVKLKNKRVNLLTQALLKADFKIEKTDDKSLVFVKEL